MAAAIAVPTANQPGCLQSSRTTPPKAEKDEPSEGWDPIALKRLVGSYVVDGFMRGQEDSDCEASDASDDSTDSGRQGFSADIEAEGLRAASMVERCAYAGSYASANCAADQGVAEAGVCFA